MNLLKFASMIGMLPGIQNPTTRRQPSAYSNQLPLELQEKKVLDAEKRRIKKKAKRQAAIDKARRNSG